MEQGTATDDTAAGDPRSDLASSVPAFILPTPDGPDPPSDLASSVPALSLPTPDAPALSDPTPHGSPSSHDDHLLPPSSWLESPDPSLQIVAASASPICILAVRQMWLFLLLCNHHLIQSFLLLSLSLLSFNVT